LRTSVENILIEISLKNWLT